MGSTHRVMNVYRITKKKYASDLSGKGAELFGGRWNPIGTPALYTSENRALSVLELLVHTPKEIVPPTYIILTLEIPDKLKDKIITIDELENKWDSLQLNDWTQKLGLKYFNDHTIVGIKVPSAILTMENNIVLNPRHSDFQQIKIIDSSKFILDERLIK